MKKTLFAYLVFASIIITCYSLGKNNEIVNNLPLLNIEALEQEQDAGNELFCDKRDNDECIIVTDGGIGYSRGFLRYIKD